MKIILYVLYNNEMKTENIFFFITVLCITHLQAFQPTKLNFVIEHQILPKTDYVEVKLQVKTNNKALSTALAESQQIIKFIIQKFQNFCLQNSKKPQDCQTITQIKKERINPLYKINKNQLILRTFQVKKQIILRVQSVKNIGVLIDKLIEEGEQITVTSFEWKSKNKIQDEVLAMNQGVQQGKRLCRQLGQQLRNIISIQEVIQFQQAEIEDNFEQQTQQAVEIQQQQASIIQKEYITFKFQVQCEKKSKK